jgi:hypothetical protein
MHSICQQTLVANFTNAELQRHGLDVEGLLRTPLCVSSSIGWRTRSLTSPPPSPKSNAEQAAGFAADAGIPKTAAPTHKLPFRATSRTPEADVPSCP